jgi:hypothetical protein
MTTIIPPEEEKEFGEFGEIAVKVCFICGKTIRKTNCFDFERQNPNNTNSIGIQGYSPKTRHPICLKCLLKGIFGICKTKEEVDKYLSLYIKVGIVDTLNKQ